MPKIAPESSHPGPRIKAEVIPKGMTVTEAAALMGVGRVALSNLLNGNAALSSDMATRLEKAFNYPRKELLEMQARHDAEMAEKRSAPDAKAYVPPFLEISANQLEQWVTHNTRARSRLSVLLRTLVHSTARGLTKVDFPGNDDAERPGPDGVVEAAEATAWIPAGHSVWEFGTSEDPKTKARRDYDKSVNALAQERRAGTTFVFVTPRRWTGKADWAARARRSGAWKDVRAYDASDLEQWLEQSLAGQAWFANETGIPSQGVRSLDKCWSDWADATAPTLSPSLFGSDIEAARRTMLSRLSGTPDGPTVIGADSTDEALAFLSQLFGSLGGEELDLYRGRVLVFGSAGVLSRLASGGQRFIPVTFTREVERELAPHTKTMHSIVVYPRNAATISCHITLKPANSQTFEKALQEMGKGHDEISRLAKASGQSLTVLRRRLATVPAVQSPDWAADDEVAASLVPFLLVGAWNRENECDRIALSLLAADRPHDELEMRCLQLSQLNDAPTWSIGSHRGVVSKLDLLYAIAYVVTPQELSRYFEVARMVLGEDDPALDLAEDQRWAAALYGKSRQFSSAFRQGISETLVLLAVHGVHLFKMRLGIDTAKEAAKVVRDLLPTPLSTRALEANDGDLPTYAEAAPSEFLSILEKDLKTETPAVLGLLRPIGSGVLGHSVRAGLLWALEGLSWNPATLSRAGLILARLAQVEINDNWLNRPINSLEAIFRAWMPQTAAGTAERVKLLQGLSVRFPDVAWKICMSQLGSFPAIGSHSYKPRWRSDAYGFGDPVQTVNEVHDFVRPAVELVLAWKEHSLGTLSELITRLHVLDDEYQAAVWRLVEAWARVRASDEEKAAMREKIRVSVLSRRAMLRARANPSAKAVSAPPEGTWAALEPKDVLNKHAWLFQDSSVEPSADDVDDIDQFDMGQHLDQIDEKRIEAIREIARQSGVNELLELARRGKAPWQIGFLVARDAEFERELPALLRSAFEQYLEGTAAAHAYKDLIRGAAAAHQEGDSRERLLRAIGAKLSEENVARLLVLAPFTRSTWRLVDGLCDTAQSVYWQHVVPERFQDSDAEYGEGVERLLKAGRPRAALSCVGARAERLDPALLFRALSDAARGGRDEPEKYLFKPYNVERAFKYLDSAPVFTLEQKAILELAFLDLLVSQASGRDDGIPNLERYINSHPELFIQAIVWTYGRKDGGMDPAELEIPFERRTGMAERGYKLLGALKRIPGRDDVGEVKADRLAAWLTAVRESCAALGRADVADHCLGVLLAHAPPGNDGMWPCEPVRQVMEEIQSDGVMLGAHTGIYNSRGIHLRGNGGDQERQLAAKYRRWADALQFSYPYVSANLLMQLAKTYEDVGSQEDVEAGLRSRLL